jgi:hypothetical protein
MRGIRSRTKVVLDRKERLDIVRGNRRLGGDIDLEERGSPRRFAANLPITHRRHRRDPGINFASH